MAKKSDKAFLKNPWTIGIGSIVIGYFITSTIAAIARSEGFLSSLWTVIKWIGRGLWVFVILRIPLWIILFVILLLVGIAYIVSLIRESPAILWKSYKMDYIKDWLFVWDYLGNSIYNLQPICSKCRCQLSVDNIYDNLYCPNCSKRYKLFSRQDESDVEKIIINRIHTGAYKNSPYFDETKD